VNDNDTILIRELKNSYTMQLGWYRELGMLVQKILGKLILSRGDISGLVSGLEKKQKILAFIENERNRTSDRVKQWQERKKYVTNEDEVQELNSILTDVEKVIKAFLNEEDQLKKYIERLIEKDSQDKDIVT
jgi:tRNA C32,U32 (ribose-2'-O)-methylase TrmJ